MTGPLTTADVDRFLHQLTLDRAQPYWSDRTTQLDGVQSWLESLRDHLQASPPAPPPTTYDASQLFPHRTLVTTHPDTDLRMVCRYPGCPYWIEASSTPQMDQLLRDHARTHQQPNPQEPTP